MTVYAVVVNGAITSSFACPQNAPTPPGYVVLADTDPLVTSMQLAQAKSAQIASVIQPAYQVAIIAPIAYTNKLGVAGVYPADTDTRTFISQMAQGNVGATALSSWGIYTTSGVKVMMTLIDLNALVLAFANQQNVAYQRYSADVAEINAATTVLAVQSIGW